MFFLRTDVDSFYSHKLPLVTVDTFTCSFDKCSSVILNFLCFLEKDSLDVWVNGCRMVARAEFVEDGTEIQFDLGESRTAGIRTVSSGNKKEGIIYSLFVNGQQIPESVD